MQMNRAVRRFMVSSLPVWLGLACFGVYFLMHLQKYVNFGIDLVGGTYLTLEVKMDNVIELELSDRIAALIKQLEKEGSTGLQLVPSQEQGKKKKTLVLEAVKGSDSVAKRQVLSRAVMLAKAAPYYLEVEELFEQDLARCSFSLTDTEIKKLTKQAINGNIQVLRSRIDKFGVGEVTIAAQGDKKIVIELPHVQDVYKAKQIVGTSALLEIKAIYDVAPTPEAFLKHRSDVIINGKLRDGFIIVPDKDPAHGFYIVPQRTKLTGRLLKNAWATPDGGPLRIDPVVNFEFTAEGGDLFYELTKPGCKPRLAILLDGVVITAPQVNCPLRTTGYIHGSFTIESAQQLAGLLKSGAFIAPVDFVEDRTIGPSLGAEAIHNGLMACGIGLLLLFIFSVSVYKIAGILAFIVLLFNLLLVLLAMSVLGATLTLPGIAGMVLTLGMAIDSSVLIFERMREELGRGGSLALAVKEGFAGAFIVILDANITTLLAGIVLYTIGSGPVQGFAVTMIVGIISTLITGLLLLKSIFSYMLEGCDVREMNI